MKAAVRLSAILILLLSVSSSYSATDIKKEQSESINKILKNTEGSELEGAVEIINYIDDVYGGLYKRLSNGDKFTIYFGPAHGKDGTERWRGITTERIGVTGLPEEWYSINYSRKLYNLLKHNKFIQVSAAPYYMDVLEGKSDSYHYMKFRDVSSNAKAANAFMVIEMHMNNVSVFEKADGLVNMPGIHMIRDEAGRRLLKNITGTYSGYLTLYNKYDASGFSKQYALNIKNSLAARGYSLNSWEYGAVGDDRFSYYQLFPVSVIYECGFISHPEEEKNLRDPYYMDGMINSHYEMLLKTINDIYGLDLSGDSLKFSRKEIESRIELLKLARLAIFFIENTNTAKANASVKAMNNYNSQQSKDSINYYSSIIRSVNRGESQYNRGLKFRKNKKYRKARECFINAKGSINRREMFYGYREKYNRALYGNRSNRNYSGSGDREKVYSAGRKTGETAVIAAESSVTKPFILALRSNQKIEDALADSLGAEEKDIRQISESMKDYRKVSWKKVRKYSSKKKKKIWVSEKTSKKFDFYQGIYVVTLDKKLNVVKAERVSAVYLDPRRYQNQQYLKNSYFAETTRERDI